jgi:membrane protease YdiL (CAAX protease family)
VNQVLQQMQADAHTAEDKIAAAIMAAEIEGAESGLSRLQELSDDSLPEALATDVKVLQQLYREGSKALDDTERNRLIQRHGYFARVALVYDVDPGAEPRKSLESAARRFSFRVFAVALALLFLGSISLMLFAAALVLLRQGRIQRKYQSDPSANSAFLEGFALYMLVFFLAIGPVRRYMGLTGLSWEWMGLVMLPLLYIWLSIRGNTSAQIKHGLGWHRGKGFFREVGAGFCGYLAGMPILVTGVLVTFILARSSGTTAGHPVVHLLGGTGWQLILLYFTVAVYAPVLEEAMFRGSLFHHLRKRWSWLAAAVVASFVFAILHPQGLAAIPALGANGAVLTAIREWRGSLIAPAAAHALNNFLAITIATLMLS